MSNVGIESGDKLQRPLSPKPGDDRRPPAATATLADSNRYHETTTANVPSIRNPTEEAKAAALRAPARVKRATDGPTDVLRALENRHRWLLFAQHCYTCTRPEGACDLGKLCTYGKKTLNHVAQCKKEECPYPRCRLLKPLLQHSRRCQSSTCAICVPVWNYIQKDSQMQQPSLPLLPAQHEQQPQQKQQPAQLGNGVIEHDPSTSWPQSVINASVAPPVPHRSPEPALARTVGLDKAEGGASTSGAGRHFTGGSAATGAAPMAGADGRLSSTGTAGLAMGGANAGAGGSGAVAQGSRVDQGVGKLNIVDSLDGPAAPDPKSAGVHRHPQGLAAAAAPTAGPAVGGAGSHRYMGLASSPLSPYGIPPYASSLPGAPGGPHPDAAERPRPGGITITATPAQPIPVANRPNVTATVKNTAVAGQQPQLVHTYPPSTSIGAFFPQLTHHHPAVSAAAPAGPAVATHWLPLQGLAAMPTTMGNSAPVSNGAANGGGGSGGLMGSSPTPSATPPQALWANAVPMQTGGPVTMYGISTDAVRPNGLSAVGPVSTMPTVDRYGHPQYTLAGVNGSSALQPAGTIAMAAAPLLLWPSGHPPPPPGAAAAPQQVGTPGHMPAHLAAPPYTMAPVNGARISAGTTTLAVGGHGGTALVSGPQMPPHALLYGHPSLGPAPPGGGNLAGSALGMDMSSGATALWGYVLR